MVSQICLAVENDPIWLKLRNKWIVNTLFGELTSFHSQDGQTFFWDEALGLVWGVFLTKGNDHQTTIWLEVLFFPTTLYISKSQNIVFLFFPERKWPTFVIKISGVFVSEMGDITMSGAAASRMPLYKYIARCEFGVFLKWFFALNMEVFCLVCLNTTVFWFLGDLLWWFVLFVVVSLGHFFLK